MIYFVLTLNDGTCIGIFKEREIAIQKVKDSFSGQGNTFFNTPKEGIQAITKDLNGRLFDWTLTECKLPD
jgi:hypothetical protein